MLAQQSGVPVVSNFRPADMVVGGQGAPLVPLLDYVLFRHPTRGRVLQNLGGIGNLTALPPKATPSQVVAFDTGPGNMVIDQSMQEFFGKPFDRAGKTAARGRVIRPVVSALLRAAFFSSASAQECRAGSNSAVLTQRISWKPAATRAAAQKIPSQLPPRLRHKASRLAYANFLQDMHEAAVDFIVSGGGARNLTLMQMLRDELEPLGCTVQASDDVGLPAEAKEAAAFALLAYETWHRRPGNIPSATGAVRPAILGQITMFEASRVRLLFVLCVLGVLAGCGGSSSRRKP